MRMSLLAVLAAVLIAGGVALGDPLGDFDHDLDVDNTDNDMLADFIREFARQGFYDPAYDISDGFAPGPDGAVNVLDFDYHVLFLLETTVGAGTAWADFNLDNEVDIIDLTRLATNYYAAGDWGRGDGNTNRYIDTVIDNTDLARMALDWVWPCDPDAVPEPTSAGLLLLGASALLRRRRKA